MVRSASAARSGSVTFGRVGILAVSYALFIGIVGTSSECGVDGHTSAGASLPSSGLRAITSSHCSCCSSEKKYMRDDDESRDYR